VFCYVGKDALLRNKGLGVAQGAGKSFAPRLKVKGKVKLSDGWSDVPEGGDPSFRFFTVEVALP
jgi:hypothetical protein